MFSSPGQCHFVWSSVRSRKVRRVMDCGGKRSATPLSHAWKASASSRVLVRAKAPSPLPLCRRTPRRFAPLALPPPIRRRLGARRAGRRDGVKFERGQVWGAKHPPPQSAGQTIRTATKNSFSFSARLRTKYHGRLAKTLTLFCQILNPHAGHAWGERGPNFGFTPRPGCGWFSASPGVVARRSRPARPGRRARL